MELVLVVELPHSEVEVVELVLVVELPPSEVEVVELVLVVVVLVVPSDVEVVLGGGCEVLVVVGRGSVVVVGAPGFLSDGTHRSEALRQVPRNGSTSCSRN